MCDGLPESVAKSLWEACAAKTRDYKGRANFEATKKAYKLEVERTIAKREKNMQARQAAKARKEKARAELQRATVKPLTEAELDMILEVAEEDVPVLHDIPEDWEELDEAPHTVYGPEGCVSACVRNVKIEGSQDITFSTPPGHAVLAASRAVMAHNLRHDGLKNMAAQRAGSMPVLFEVGAGSGGVKAAVALKDKYKEAAHVYMHCTFPVAGADDLARDALLLGRSKFAHDLTDRVNWVDRTGAVSLTKVNVCGHLARDCTCLALYGPNYVYALHSSYYFEDRDWDQLFKYTDDVRIGVHLPERDGQRVPSDIPEFRWQSLRSVRELCEHFGLIRGLSAAAENIFLGHQHVAFKPMTAHGTTYCHRDLAPDIRRGGFHIVQYTAQVDRVMHSPAALAAVGAGAVVAVAQIPEVLSSVLRRRVPWVPMAKMAACLAPCWLMSGVGHARNSVEPMANARYTVKVVPGWDYVRQAETICQVYQMRRVPLSTLEPRTISTQRPNPLKAREMAASLALANNPAKAERAVAAMGFRSGLSPTEVKDTIQAAKDYCSIVLEPKNDQGSLPSAVASGSDQALSVWDSSPSQAAGTLGRVVTGGVLIQAAVSQLPLRVLTCGIGLPNELSALSMTAPSIQRLCEKLRTCNIVGPQSEAARRMLDWVQACAESLSQVAPSSPAAQSWQSMLSLNGIWRPQLMPSPSLPSII